MLRRVPSKLGLAKMALDASFPADRCSTKHHQTQNIRAAESQSSWVFNQILKTPNCPFSKLQFVTSHVHFFNSIPVPVLSRCQSSQLLSSSLLRPNGATSAPEPSRLAPLAPRAEGRTERCCLFSNDQDGVDEKEENEKNEANREIEQD